MIKQLVTHKDERGLLVELWRMGFNGINRQVTLFTVDPGQERAGHKHPRTNETWVFISGRGKMWLEYPPDNERVEMTIDVADDGFFKILLPAGTGHKVRNEGDVPLVCIYVADRWYDPDDPDVEVWEVWEAGDDNWATFGIANPRRDIENLIEERRTLTGLEDLE